MSTCGELLHRIWLADSPMSTCGEILLLGLMDSMPLLSLSICIPVSFTALWTAASFGLTMVGVPVNMMIIILFGSTELMNVTSSKVDSIWCMPPSILILADHVYPVGGVSSKGLDFNCSVQREEVLHWGCVAPCLSPIRQVTASHPAHDGIIGRVQAIPYQPILILQSDTEVQKVVELGNQVPRK